MRRRVVGVIAVMLIGAAGCGGGSSTSGVGGHGAGGNGGTGGSQGSGGAGGGTGGSTGSGGAVVVGTGGMTDAGADVPAVGGMTGSGGAIADAGLIPASCPATMNGALEATDSVQTGRESRIPNAGVCGAPKLYPGNAADPSNPHFYDAYHFVNPSGASVCFNFTLTYDSGSVDGSTGVQRYLTAYSTYDPANIGNNYLGDVGATLTSPQTMSITVPAGSSIDVVVFALDVAPSGVGSYVLSCGTGSGDAGTDAADGGGGAGGGGGNDGGTADGGGGGGADGSADAQDAAPDA